MNSKTRVSRRTVLRGLGVGLALPWLESLAPPTVRAQAAGLTKRYLLVYFPCGVAENWWPATGAPTGAAWKLTAPMEPLAPYKKYLQMVSGVGQEALYNMGKNPNPSHSLYAAPSFSCTVADTKNPILGGPTTDQIIAKTMVDQLTAQKLPLPAFKSLQLGCSTMNSSSDGRHPSLSRSISWAATDEPLYKEVNPQKVFDTLVMQLAPSGGAANPQNQALAQLRKDRDLSILDYVTREASSLNAKLSVSDRHKVDGFLTSVRDLEGRVRLQGTVIAGGGAKKSYVRPTIAASYNERRSNDPVNPMDPAGYNRNDHAEAMNDLITMAFETDLTRVITHMLDDARSDYHYRFLKQRTFTGNTSVEIDVPLNTVLSGSEIGYHGLSHNDQNGFATVNHWFAQKFGSLLGRLSTSIEADGKSVLDNTVALFMSGMHGTSHELLNLPIMLASGGKTFKADTHTSFPTQVRLADLHLTLLQSGFGVPTTKLGYSQGTVPALLV